MSLKKIFKLSLFLVLSLLLSGCASGSDASSKSTLYIVEYDDFLNEDLSKFGSPVDIEELVSLWESVTGHDCEAEIIYSDPISSHRASCDRFTGLDVFDSEEDLLKYIKPSAAASETDEVKPRLVGPNWVFSGMDDYYPAFHQEIGGLVVLAQR